MRIPNLAFFILHFALCAALPAHAGEPLVRIGDQIRHVNHTDFLQRAVLFRDVGADNWQQVLEECRQGGFGILMSTWTEPGDYHTPWQYPKNSGRTSFENFAALKQACAAFRAAGIELQWHGYWNALRPHGASLLGFTDRGNPPAPWIDIVETVPVGALTHDVSATNTQFILDRAFTNDAAWQHIAQDNKGVPTRIVNGTTIRGWGRPWHRSIYAVGKEIVYCFDAQIDGRVMRRVIRAGYSTTATAHPAGTQVALVPNNNYYFLKAGSAMQRQAIEQFERAYDQLGMSAVYCDGWSGPNRPDEDSGRSTEGMYARYLAPYFKNVDGLIQFGGAVPRAVGDRCRLSALGDAWWLYSKFDGDLSAYIHDFASIASRRPCSAPPPAPCNVPYRPQLGWIPADGNTTPETWARIVKHPAFRGMPVCLQVLPGRGAPGDPDYLPAWEDKPAAERAAMLAYFNQLNRAR